MWLGVLLSPAGELRKAGFPDAGELRRAGLPDAGELRRAGFPDAGELRMEAESGSCTEIQFV